MIGPISILLGLLNLTALALFFHYFRRTSKRTDRRADASELRLQSQIESLGHRIACIELRTHSLEESVERTVAQLPHGMANVLSSVTISGHRHYKHFHFETRLLVVLSLPKCGGSSLRASLAASFPDAIVRHVHVHSRQGMAALAQWAETANEVTRQAIPGHLAIANDVRAMCAAIAPPNTVYFAGVREPVGYAISAYFERFYDAAQSSLPAAADVIQGFADQAATPISLDRWFDSELLPATGCDVFASPFPSETGYFVYTDGRVRLCVYRLENFDRIKSAIADSLDLPEEMVVLEARNQASDKSYADAYRTMLRETRFPRSFLAEVYSSRYARHFYRDDERAALIDRWAAD